MRKYLVVILLFLSSVCHAQNQYFNYAVIPQTQTVDEHTAWIVDVYMHSLQLSKQQKEKLFEIIRVAYLEVSSNEFFGKVKGKDDLEALQSIVIHNKIKNEFPVLLLEHQKKNFLAMGTRPEDCFSLNKEYRNFPCCPSFATIKQ